MTFTVSAFFYSLSFQANQNPGFSSLIRHKRSWSGFVDSVKGVMRDIGCFFVGCNRRPRKSHFADNTRLFKSLYEYMCFCMFVCNL